VWQLPGVVVVLVEAVVVCEPPAGNGVVLVELCDVVVDGGVVGVAGVVTVVLCVVVDAGGVVCASESGTAIARLTQSAPAASNAFMDVPPGRKPARRFNPLPPALVASLSQCPSRAARSGA
jgi:hypothetical protein